MTAAQSFRAILVALVVSFLVSALAASMLTGHNVWPGHFSMADQTSATGLSDGTP